MGLKDLRDRASNYDLEAKIVPGHKIARMRNYRNERGERIGMPEKPGVSSVTADMGDNLLDGPLTGFGNYLVKEGKLDESELRAGRTRLPEEDVAEQDLAPDRTPGGGTEIDDDSYEEIRSSGNRLIARRTISQWKADLRILKSNFAESQRTAQDFENKGMDVKAGVFDDKSLRIAQKIKNLEVKIAARTNYENEMMSHEDVPSGFMDN